MVVRERKVVMSFRLAKDDIVALKSTVKRLETLERELQRKVGILEKEYEALSKKRPAARRKPKVFVSSKAGKKFHDPHCPFAHNIKPETRLTFHSKNKALNEGFTPCACTV